MQDLSVTLLRATGNHIYYKIQSQTHRDIYEQSMRRCLEFLQQPIDDAIQLITEYKLQSNILYPTRLFNMHNKAFYHEMACNNAIDVLQSIKTRFIDGGQKHYLVMSGGWLYEDKSIF